MNCHIIKSFYESNKRVKAVNLLYNWFLLIFHKISYYMTNVSTFKHFLFYFQSFIINENFQVFSEYGLTHKLSEFL